MLRISTFGILWKPAFQDALFLLENFLYRPERGKGKDAADSRDENAFNQQGSDSSRYSQNKKDPPAFRAPIIFRFHHNRMKKPDNQKGSNTYQQSIKVNHVHICLRFKTGLSACNDKDTKKYVSSMINYFYPLIDNSIKQNKKRGILVAGNLFIISKIRFLLVSWSFFFRRRNGSCRRLLGSAKVRSNRIRIDCYGIIYLFFDFRLIRVLSSRNKSSNHNT